MDTSNSTYSGDWNNESLTMEKLLEAKKIIDEKYPCPFQEFAKKNGFDLDKGDVMILPKKWAAINGIYPTRDNVVLSPHFTDEIIFMKGVGPVNGKITPPQFNQTEPTA